MFSWTSDSRNVRSTKWSVRKGIWQSKQFLENHVHQLRTPSQKIFCKSINFKIKYCKKFHCKISLYYQTVTDQRLTAFHQLFTWASAGPSKCPIDKMISLQGYLTIWRVHWLHWLTAPPLAIFSKWIIFQITYCKKIHCHLIKFSLHSLTTSWSKASSLSPTVQLDLSWTLKMSDQQNDRFPRPSETLSISPSATLHHPEALSKLIHCPLKKFNLHSLTASWPKATRLSPTVQLDFSWTLEMSDWQNARLARPSESLSKSLNTMCTIWEPIHKIFFESH